jgi:hypothetical protein
VVVCCLFLVGLQRFSLFCKVFLMCFVSFGCIDDSFCKSSLYIYIIKQKKKKKKEKKKAYIDLTVTGFFAFF